MAYIRLPLAAIAIDLFHANNVFYAYIICIVFYAWYHMHWIHSFVLYLLYLMHYNQDISPLFCISFYVYCCKYLVIFILCYAPCFNYIVICILFVHIILYALFYASFPCIYFHALCAMNLVLCILFYSSSSMHLDLWIVLYSSWYLHLIIAFYASSPLYLLVYSSL